MGLITGQTRDEAGNIVAAATITVHLSGTLTPATLYADFARTMGVGNPIAVDANGAFGVFVADGVYDLVIAYPGAPSDTIVGLAAIEPAAYAFLAGRAGGQTLLGGLAAGENLTLGSTAHATKGKIFFGSLAAYDEVNDRLGVGTTSPLALLDVRGAVTFNDGGLAVDFRVEGDTDPDLFHLVGALDRIGVGTATPGSKFHVAGNLTVDSAGTAAPGASAVGVIVLGPATAPTSSPTDVCHVWADDAAAGDKQVFARNEAGKVERLTGLLARNTAQFDKAASTTLADVTGLTHNLLAGRTYAFTARLHYNADATGGQKYAIGGTCTATTIKYQITAVQNSTGLNVLTSRQVALGASGSQAGSTAGYTEITGMITVNAAGTLTVQFAQSAASGTSSILTGSNFEIHPTGD